MSFSVFSISEFQSFTISAFQNFNSSVFQHFSNTAFHYFIISDSLAWSSDQAEANCAWARRTKTNEFWQIWAKPNEPGKPGENRQKKWAFLGKNGAKNGRNRAKKGQKTGKNRKKTDEQNRTLAKQGETKSFAEFWVWDRHPQLLTVH